MKSFPISLLLLFLPLLMTGCQMRTEHSHNNKSLKVIDSVEPKKGSVSDLDIKDTINSDLSCDSMLTLLIKSSNIDTNLKKFKVTAEEMNNGILKISISNINELGHKTPIAWLTLDTSTLQLQDITIDPVNPKILNYDTTLFHALLNKCLR